ncbi:MAG: glycoside hydrolase family 3 C-terminal domain-containing protein, partial [Syntrophothermus sp.]
GGAEVIYEQGCEVADGMPSFEVIGASFLYTSEDKKENGLRGEFFNNSNFSGAPAVVKTDKVIDFNWGDSAPDSGFSSEDFSVRWTGVLVPQKSGEYKLGGYGFSGFRIFLDDTLLCSFEGEHESVKSYKTVSLTAGKSYKIRIELYKTLRYSFIRLIWSVPDENRLARALEAAKKADAVILMMGLSPRLEGEEMNVDIKGFKGGDRLTLDLPESQQKLIKMIHALRKPLVLVLLNGSAVSVNWENENIPAIIEAWYPGQEAGTAIADVIFGDFNPSGRLPVTFYKSAEQLPAFTDYNMDGRTYRYFKDTPLYPFGYGLSYTTFSYKNVKLEKSELNPGEQTIISFEVANTGRVKGEETAQLYIKAADDTKALKTLKGFMKLTLNPGETKCGEFRISSEELSRWIDGKGYSAGPGKYIIWIGSSSAEKDLIKTELTVRSR